MNYILKLSSEEMEEAINQLSRLGDEIKPPNVYEFVMAWNLLSTPQFRRNIFTEFCNAQDNGYSGGITEFLRECIRILNNAISYIILVFHKLKDKAKQEFKRLEKNCIINVEVLKNEIARIRATHQQEPPTEPHELTPKQKIILLNECGFLTALHQMKNKNTTQTAQIVGKLLNINPTTAKTYILPILQPYQDLNHPNSPYNNPKNIEVIKKML